MVSGRRTVEDYRRLVFAATNLTPAVQVFLVWLSLQESRIRSTPFLQVSVPRSMAAKALNTTEATVKQRTRTAVEKGYLSRISGGYTGVAATYQLTFPDAVNGVSDSYPIDPKGVSNSKPLSPVEFHTPLPGSSGGNHAQRGMSPIPPIRTERPQPLTEVDVASPCPECEYAGCSLCDGWASA